MILYFDTNHPESLKIELTEAEQKGKLSDNLLDFVYSLSTLATTYMLQEIDPGMRSSVYDHFGELFTNTLAIVYRDLTTPIDVKLEEEAQLLRNEMQATGRYSPEVTEAMYELVIDAGGLDNALTYLKNLSSENNH